MCNYVNNYDNLKGCMLIKLGIHLYEKCIIYLSGKFSKLYINIKKSHYGFKAYLYPNIITPLANWTSYASITKVKKLFFLNLMPKRGDSFCHPQLYKVLFRP